MDLQQAATYWQTKDQTAIHMDRSALLAEAERFIKAHNTCALATGWDTRVRCTPIEYTYWKGRFWMLSEGGKKFLSLAHNLQVSLAIYDAFATFQDLGGMQVDGTAVLVEPWTEEYCALLQHKKIPESALRGLDHPMYLICVQPAHIDFLCGAWKEKGFSSRQALDF